jgi:hypothetical protein
MASSAPVLQKFYNYSAAGIAYNSRKIQGVFPASHSQAAARAALRFLKFGDGAEHNTRRNNIVGLHPMYFAFRDAASGLADDPSAGDKLLQDTLTDVFDAVSENFTFLKLAELRSDYHP